MKKENKREIGKLSLKKKSVRKLFKLNEKIQTNQIENAYNRPVCSIVNHHEIRNCNRLHQI